ncbi:hypothetical protein DFH08DRAFT_1084352 [Mycena albidolilacea]|uniref:Uncharacterized protein n=1 Tax=Mycena albidolilacea TaxID=1033008 RepID=A0AAD6ZM07_9AGAR|nr:hypothetical protein DFH08DRAFT_1084352 [Mycena albidolilacea]
MTDIVPVHRPDGLKMKRTSSGILLFHNKLPKHTFTALAPIIELDEPGPGENWDQGTAALQVASYGSERTSTGGMRRVIPNKLLHLEFRHSVHEHRGLSNSNKPTTPTVEFTSLSLTESKFAPLCESRPLPLRAVSNFQSRQRNSTNNKFSSMPGNIISTLEPDCGFPVESLAAGEGCIERRTRKRSRELGADDGRVDAKRQRTAQNRGPPPRIPIDVEITPCSMPSSHPADRLPPPRQSLRLKAKRSLEQAAQDEATDIPRYTKRRRIGV